MSELGVGTAILSVSAPGTTFLPNPADAAALARDLNEHLAAVVAARTRPVRFLRDHSDATCQGIRRRSGEISGRTARRWRPSCRRSATGERGGHLPGPGRARRSVRRARCAFGGGIHPPRRTARPRRGRCPTVCGRLPAGHHAGGVSACPQRDSAQVPEHPVHPQPRRRIRAVRLAPNGGRHHERHRTQPDGQPGRLRGLLLRHGVFHHPREAIGGRPRNARHAHCGRAHNRTRYAHHCPACADRSPVPTDSGPRCPRPPRRYRACWPSPSPGTSPSAPTGPSRPSRPASCSPRAWRPTRGSRATPARRSTAPTRWRYSRAWERRRRPMPARRSITCVMPPAER